jgi:HD-like signal output (HDOD) protein
MLEEHGWDEDLWRRFGRTLPPPLPDPAVRGLLAALADDGLDPGALVTEIDKHPRLKFGLVVLANGPVWGSARPARNVADAVRQLGRRGCALAAWVVAVHDVVLTSGEMSPRAADRLWRHLALTGLLCRELVKELGTSGVTSQLDEGLAAGLVHDIGHLLLEQPGGRLNVIWHDEHELLVEGDEPPPDEWDHCRIGAALLELWDAPSELVETALRHHDPASALPIHQPLVTATRLADLVAECVHAETAMEGWSLRSDPAFEVLESEHLLDGISPREIEAVLMCALAEAQLQVDRWAGLLALR